MNRYIGRPSCVTTNDCLQITTNTVEHALEMLGVRNLCHMDYFSVLLSSSTALPSDAESDDTNKSSKPTEGSTCQQEDPTTPALPAHRNIYTPLVRLPSALGVHSLNCFAWTYMREASRRVNRCVEQDESEEVSLMPDETDEEVPNGGRAAGGRGTQQGGCRG